MPSLDPPTIAVNPKRRVVLQIPTTQLIVPGTLGLDDIATQLTAQTGITKTVSHFVIERINMWGDGAASETVGIVDGKTAVAARDNGSFAQRARCGLFYPMNIRTVNSGNSSTSFAELTSTSTSALLQVTVTYWGE
jgi:hypothetical protein